LRPRWRRASSALTIGSVTAFHLPDFPKPPQPPRTFLLGREVCAQRIDIEPPARCILSGQTAKKRARFYPFIVRLPAQTD
jgi:hypothetical protein